MLQNHKSKYMGVEPKNRGGDFTPPKWMVYFMVPNPMNKWDDLGVFPLFLETPIYVKDYIL